MSMYLGATVVNPASRMYLQLGSATVEDVGNRRREEINIELYLIWWRSSSDS